MAKRERTRSRQGQTSHYGDNGACRINVLECLHWGIVLYKVDERGRIPLEYMVSLKGKQKMQKLHFLTPILTACLHLF